MVTKSIIEDAIKTFGEDNQLIVAIEELSELQKTITKALRGEPNFESVVEELADVEIMCEQLKEIFHCHDAVLTYKVQKLLRLSQRIEIYKDEK